MAVTTKMISVALGVADPEPESIQALQWQMWIEDAEMLIEDRRREINPDVLLDEAKVSYVVREAVKAHVQKPDDATQVTIAIDDGSTSRTYKSGEGRVTIIDKWWALLGLVEEETGAFSIDMVGFANLHLPWCASMFAATYCSCGVDIAGRPIFEGGDQW
jgi:hypothetical protein